MGSVEIVESFKGGDSWFLVLFLFMNEFEDEIP